MNTALEAQGFGSGLLCTLVPFADAGGRRVGLVYLYRRARSTRSPARAAQQRDNLLEIQVRDAPRRGAADREGLCSAGWRSGVRPGL